MHHFTNVEKGVTREEMREFLPKTHSNMPHSVHSDSIKAVFIDNYVSHPGEKNAFDFLALCVEVWQAEQSAFLQGSTVVYAPVFVSNLAPIVIVFVLIERDYL